MNRSPYQILGVSKLATIEEIRSAYRAKARRYHPDHRGGTTEKFQKINEAYHILADPVKRAAFDAKAAPKHQRQPDKHARVVEAIRPATIGHGMSPEEFLGFMHEFIGPIPYENLLVAILKGVRS